MNYFNVNQLDYASLVNMLMQNITPVVRASILNRLIEMNNVALNNMKQIKQTQHQQPNLHNISVNKIVIENISLSESDDTIEIDDLIDDVPNELDTKLARLTNLYNKLLEKKKSRKNKK